MTFAVRRCTWLPLYSGCSDNSQKCLGTRLANPYPNTSPARTLTNARKLRMVVAGSYGGLQAKYVYSETVVPAIK